MSPSKIVTGAALAGVLCFCGCSKSANTDTPKTAASTPAKAPPAAFELKSAVGHPTPMFSLKDANGQSVHPADYKGKVLLLDFWATWCGPCKIEIPWFIDFERQFKDQGFAVLGVSMDEDGWKAIKPYMDSMKMNYRVALGDDDVSTAYGGLDSLPTTLLIDRQGNIASVHVGVTMGKDEFKDAIQKLLNAPQHASIGSGNILAGLTRPDVR
ncbi:MAG TPA: TlpA disulfide reductase family protein [Bryobacteraceae bacterium]|nr:TlpA disulfide reductase family protein [Bryobacteraceae bacterium]